MSTLAWLKLHVDTLCENLRFSVIWFDIENYLWTQIYRENKSSQDFYDTARPGHISLQTLEYPEVNRRLVSNLEIEFIDQKSTANTITVVYEFYSMTITGTSRIYLLNYNYIFSCVLEKSSCNLAQINISLPCVSSSVISTIFHSRS